MWIFFIMFALGGPTLIVLAIKTQREYKECSVWPSSEGVVTKSYLSGNQREGRSACIQYDFKAAGQIIVGCRVNFSESGDHTDEHLARYPVGKRVTVFYDPLNPKCCVLEKKMGGIWIWYTLGVLFCAVAPYFLFRAMT
jgi:hypothetical protein